MYFILGTSLPTDGPGLSARIRLICEPPLSGTMASRNTRTPMPPIQCVKLLHKSEQCESPSTFARMLAPVVVKPDIVSNRASVKDGISPVTKKGRQPIRLSRIHARDVLIQPSLRYSVVFSGLFLVMINPLKKQADATMRYATASCSRYISPTNAGRSMRQEVSRNTCPNIYLIIDLFMLHIPPVYRRIS